MSIRAETLRRKRAKLRAAVLEAAYVALNGGETGRFESFKLAGDAFLATTMELTADFIGQVRRGEQHMSPHTAQWLRTKLTGKPGGNKVQTSLLTADADDEVRRLDALKRKTSRKKKKTPAKAASGSSASKRKARVKKKPPR